MGLILDSSILIAAERGRFDLPTLFQSRPDEAFFIAAITASELLHGVQRADTPERREQRSSRVEAILQKLPVIDFDLTTARRHAVLWADLQARRQLIGPHDMLIAATALERGYELTTLNHDEFARVQGVTVVDVRPFVIQKV
ncbi:MAG TPA: VapC toxin family PIN domain ribonuclease [Verrucomicrobiales bacterium]|nr:VapC toxin family PIN domain ribonuclease [Verrucomicrobiales bacterium]